MKRIILLITAGLALASVCSAKPVSEITPEDLLATSFTQYDARQLLPDPQNWWPELPALNVGLDMVPGKRFHVVWNYRNISDGCGNLQVATNLFESEQAARDGFKTIVDEDKQGAQVVEGPQVGEQCMYINLRGDDGRYETRLRYQVRETVGRISLLAAENYPNPQEVAKLAAPVVNRINWLLDGRLAPKPIPADIEALMPPAKAVEISGPVLGTTVMPVDAWASIDTFGDPSWIKKTLMSGGVTQLGLRRYAVKGNTDHAIEVTLFKFADEESAKKWVQIFINESRQHDRLNPGRTGQVSVYEHNQDVGCYELQFAKGKIACDICGFAPLTDTLPLVEKPVRELAELWYRSLK